jgi:hypothetical protein
MTSYAISEVLRIVAGVNAKDRACRPFDLLNATKGAKAAVIKTARHCLDAGLIETDAVGSYYITEAGGDYLDSHRPVPVNPELLATASEVEGT